MWVFMAAIWRCWAGRLLLLALTLVKGIFILADNLNCLELFREIW